MPPLSSIRNNLVDLVYNSPALSRDLISRELEALNQALDEVERLRNQLNTVGALWSWCFNCKTSTTLSR